MKPYFQDAAVTIFHGCAEELVPMLGRFDLVLTDPPYGIGANIGTGHYGKEKFRDDALDWDANAPAVEVLDVLLGASDRAIIWGGNYFELPPSRNFLVWDKGAGFAGRDFAECEQAWVSWDGNARIFRHDPLAAGDYRNGAKLHPTQKPLRLMTWCIGLADVRGRVETILDCYAGSGTTGRAAKDLGRKAVLIEREERFCEIAAMRMAQEVLALGPM